MKHHILSLLFCFNVVSCLAQSKSFKDDFSVALRGKVASFFIIEDQFFRTATFGGELSFKERHSVGIDLSYWRWRRQTDEPDPIALYDELESRTFLYFDYKLNVFKRPAYYLYLNSYYRIGEYKMWHERYENNESTQNIDFTNSSTIGTFSEVGLGIGIKFFLDNQINEKRKWGLDFSINAASRFDTNDKLIYYTASDFVDLSRVDEQKYVPYLKLNLFYRIK